MPIVSCPRCGAKNRVSEEKAHLQPVCGRCGAELSAAGPLELTDATFQQAVQAAGSRPLLVDCWAAWCGPCRMLAPTIDALAAESAGRYLVAKLDIERNPRTAQAFGVQSIPTLLLFKNGALVDRLVGLQPKPAIAAKLSAHLQPG
ncbi:MAG TPA: thioredoxin [Armatimonadota bacterium]|nr:thioredoxin [Armatimonadota bacterium]